MIPRTRSNLEKLVRLDREALAGPLGYWDRQEAEAALERDQSDLDRLIAEEARQGVE